MSIEALSSVSGLDNGVFYKTNSVCCRLNELSRDLRLTQAERALFYQAWRIATEASSSVLHRELALENTEDADVD